VESDLAPNLLGIQFNEIVEQAKDFAQVILLRLGLHTHLSLRLNLAYCVDVVRASTKLK
jgi:hypothetical protein